ncbi:MAG: Hsp20/alpha crystallin family protein [Candidatus Hydrogenedentes bacterium]|nr:Hsp20/alpha crystallin family protein [Candidatus Hydrogenedentota bacterium]
MTKLVPATVKESVERLRDDVMGIFEKWLPDRKRMERSPITELWSSMWLNHGGPAVDVEEDDANIHVTAELPGMNEDDFDVEVAGTRLILRGEKKSNREEKKHDYYYSECSYGSFTRSIDLPCEVQADKAKASYKHGVLKLTLPKSNDAKAKRIKVIVS